MPRSLLAVADKDYLSRLNRLHASSTSARRPKAENEALPRRAEACAWGGHHLALLAGGLVTKTENR
ncbi:hypothetical protein AGMMS50268_21640 [Spirochaetia bacterium]|nr:hypothetical protein AGMMS50268_21640 [Spirochaetia bacterium]